MNKYHGAFRKIGIDSYGTGRWRAYLLQNIEDIWIEELQKEKNQAYEEERTLNVNDVFTASDLLGTNRTKTKKSTIEKVMIENIIDRKEEWAFER